MSSGAAAASPWGQQEGQNLSIQRVDHYQADGPNRSFAQTALRLYAEQGIGENFTVGGKFAQGWQTVDTNDVVDQRSGILEGEVFVQRPLATVSSAVFAIQASYAAPTEASSALSPSFDDRTDAASEFAVLSGASRGRIFLTNHAGYRVSLGNDADQFRFFSTLGMNGRTNDKGRQTLFLLEQYTTLAAGGAEEGGQSYDLITLSPSIAWPIGSHHGLQLGATFDLSGTDVDLGQSLFVALWRQK